MYETVVEPALGYRKAFAILPHRALDGRWYWFCWVWVIEEWVAGLMGPYVWTKWWGRNRPTHQQVRRWKGRIAE